MRDIKKEDWELLCTLLFGHNLQITIRQGEVESLLTHRQESSCKTVFIFADTDSFIPSIKYDYYIDVHNNLVMEGLNKMESAFNYICNPDGTVRWVFPREIKAPSYLNFYNSLSIERKIYKTLTQLLFKIGLQKQLFDGGFTIYRSGDKIIDQMLNTLEHDQYSIFMDSLGLSKKI